MNPFAAKNVTTPAQRRTRQMFGGLTGEIMGRILPVQGAFYKDSLLRRNDFTVLPKTAKKGAYGG